VLIASGSDITRSAAGSFMTESLWLPSMLCGDGVSWSENGPGCVVAQRNLFGEPAQLTIDIDETGRAWSLKVPRWGNPEGGPFHYADFGGVTEDEQMFSGFTVPIRIRAGWYFGTDRFEREGEFFRAAVEDAEYR
jgi:hypothetical protein